MERVRRIELLSLAWKAKVLPLHNTRKILINYLQYKHNTIYNTECQPLNIKNGSSARIRTEISQLSVATEYKPAVLPLNYTATKLEWMMGVEPT